MMDRVAITTCEIDEDLETALRTGTQWGIRNFELRSVWGKRVPRFTEAETANLLALVREYEAQVVAISPSVFRGEYSDEESAESLAVLDKTYDLAEALGCTKIVVFSYRRREDESPDLIPEQVIAVLRDAAEAAQTRGLELVHEPMATLYGNTSANLLRLVQAVNHPGFNINWDPANMCKADDADIYPAGYQALKTYVRHVHLKNWLPDDNWSVLARGVLDWTDILAALQRDGYAGYLTIETHHGPLLEKSRANYDWLKMTLSAEG